MMRSSRNTYLLRVLGHTDVHPSVLQSASCFEEQLFLEQRLSSGQGNGRWRLSEHPLGEESGSRIEASAAPGTAHPWRRADTALLMASNAGCIIREGLDERVLTFSPESLLWPRSLKAVLAPGVLLASCGEKVGVFRFSPSRSFPPWATWTKRRNASESPAFGGLETLPI